MPWHNAAKVSQLTNDTGISVVLPGRKKPIALFCCDGQFFAIADECSHAFAPLSEGKVKEHIVICPWHGARFDVRTGECQEFGSYGPVRIFSTRVVGDDVQVEI